MPESDPTFKRVRSELVYFPVPPGWTPDPVDEKYWLEDLDALTPQEIRELDRFSPAVGGVEIVPPEELNRL